MSSNAEISALLASMLKSPSSAASSSASSWPRFGSFPGNGVVSIINQKQCQEPNAHCYVHGSFVFPTWSLYKRLLFLHSRPELLPFSQLFPHVYVRHCFLPHSNAANSVVAVAFAGHISSKLCVRDSDQLLDCKPCGPTLVAA